MGPQESKKYLQSDNRIKEITEDSIELSGSAVS